MSSLNPLVVDEAQLVQKLLDGSAALFPTDTVPALAACPKDASKLWSIKKRSKDKPLILMGARQDELFQLVLPVALRDACSMANRYWPGAITLVLPAFGELVDSLNPASGSIGMRVPACRMTRKLLAKTGPLATTSANLSGQCSALNANEAARIFPNVPLLGPLPWPDACGLASTVICWKSPGKWHLLRRGVVLPSNLQKI